MTKQKPIRAPKPENAWDRQPKEGAKPYAAFREYLLLGGDRSVRKVAQRLGKSATLIGRWSSEHRWVARADAFDAEAARRQDEAAMDVLEQRAARQAELAADLTEAMAAPSLELLRRLELKTGSKELKDLPLSELAPIAATTARTIPKLVQTERLARGQSTTNVGGHKGGPLETTGGGRSAAAREAAEARVADMPTEAIDALLLGADAARRIDQREKGGAKTPA